MASGHVNRVNRPNTWPQPTSCTVKKTLANREPSTHGTTRPSCSLGTRSVTQPEAAMASSSRHGRVVPYLEPALGVGSEATMSIEGQEGLNFLCDDEKARHPAALGQLGCDRIKRLPFLESIGAFFLLECGSMTKPSGAHACANFRHA